VSVAGDSANNVFFTTHALMDPELGTEGIQAFITAYTDAYGHAPENAFAALGYDAMKLLADAIERAGSTDAAAIQQALEATTDFPGITGTITFANGDHIPQKGVTIIQIVDGQFTLVEEVVPEAVPAANPNAAAEPTEEATASS
jgi:branched-chain amino acid transport system substrate-binding protein